MKKWQGRALNLSGDSRCETHHFNHAIGKKGLKLTKPSHPSTATPIYPLPLSFSLSVKCYSRFSGTLVPADLKLRMKLSLSQCWGGGEKPWLPAAARSVPSNLAH